VLAELYSMLDGSNQHRVGSLFLLFAGC